MKTSLDKQLEEECMFFAQTIEQERHRGVNLTPIYQQIEEDIVNRYNVSKNYIKSKVLMYQLDIFNGLYK